MLIYQRFGEIVMRGTHPRNWIQVDTGYENDGLVDADIHHEEPCEPYGTFGVIDGGYYSRNKWYVIWRPSRRNTRHWDIRVMTHPGQQRVGVYDCCDDAIHQWHEFFGGWRYIKRHGTVYAKTIDLDTPDVVKPDESPDSIP